MNKNLLLVIGVLFVGCSTNNPKAENSSNSGAFQEPKTLKIKQEDIYNEMIHVNNRLVNSDKRVDVLNEKVNTISKQKDKTEEIDAKLQEHEKVLMALMNDVVDLSKSQKNLQTSNKIIHQELQDIKIKIDNISPTTFEIKKKASIRNFPSEDKPIVKVWDVGTRFTAYSTTEDWIKISGQFVDGKWVQVYDELWVNKANTKKFR